MIRRALALLAGLLTISGVMWLTAAEPTAAQNRTRAQEAVKQGNWRDAFEIYSDLVLSEEATGDTLARDFKTALDCLARLNQFEKTDEFRENVVKTHDEEWKLLAAAGESLLHAPHYGFLVAGEFRRGNHRGGGQYVDSTEWDRSRAIQLFRAAHRVAEKTEVSQQERATLYRQLADALLFDREGGNAWQLQQLTDLSTLPEFEERTPWLWRNERKGAPVTADGAPVFYSVPESWDAASSDGERWRFALMMLAEADASRADEAEWELAEFLHNQFGVHTLNTWGIQLPGTDDAEKATGPFALPTLDETETIARLATGVKRFILPDEFNYIRLFEQLARRPQGTHAERAAGQLAAIFENRMQYPRAAEWWEFSINHFGDRQQHKAARLKQIVGNWGEFEPAVSQPSGEPASLSFRFRNAGQVTFTAHALKVDQLLKDVQDYLQTRPKQIDWQRTQINDIGYQIIQRNQQKYLGDQVARWELDLEPRDDHFDRRISVTTPLDKAGAYLVTAQVADGNTSRIIVWLDNAAIVKKPMDNQTLYYIADAVTGAPIEGANVEFFGWRQEHVPDTPRDFRVLLSRFAESSDENGFIFTGPQLQQPNMQWLVIARTDDGRQAHLGFTGVWYNRRHDPQYHQIKTYVVTDRPVYRPDQTVHFKLWVREAKYDKEAPALFAGQTFDVVITDPAGTEVHREKYTADDSGGLSGEYRLPAGASLGNYSLAIVPRRGASGGGSFRVEEYRKPEFEVTVDAPATPVQLGDAVTATIKARYYFGAPVTNATVRYKVERTPLEIRWFPVTPWDWLYGEGYWWFAPDRPWYPGAARWATAAPRPYWIHWQPDPPELVLDHEVPIGEDGTVSVEIDTALAQALHSDEDHRYTITAEVVDASRRTIVGQGNVMVAREPFRIYAWTHRGHYQVGQTIEAHFCARTIDGNGVAGKGTLKLFQITYDDDRRPHEKLVQEWELDTDDDGRASQSIKAADPGQYRLALELTARTPEAGDADGLLPNVDVDTIEGATLFIIRGEGFDGSDFRFNDLELILDKPDYAPGDTAELLVNTDRADSTVLLFKRPVNGLYPEPPEVLRLNGKSTVATLDIVRRDMPNIFVEAITIADGRVHTVARKLVVPPEDRVLNVDIQTDQNEYLPGSKASVEVRVTDADGEPFRGSVVMSVYDRAVEYISGGSNVPEIREFFWKWQRSHHPMTEHSLERWFSNLLKPGELAMQSIGVFGDLAADEEVLFEAAEKQVQQPRRGRAMLSAMDWSGAAPAAAPAPAAARQDMGESAVAESASELIQPTVRSSFADTAYWNAAITTDEQGLARVSFDMPENLTSWKIRAWGMGAGTRVGEQTREVVTSKNLIVRLQAPRFFVETDEVVLSAIVHNYLQTEKEATVSIEVEGGTLQQITRIANPRPVLVPADGEARVEWRFKAVAEGTAKITARALTDEESDAMQQSFPVYVHGQLKTESFTGVIRPDQESALIHVHVPEDRRPDQTRLEIRYSPTLAGAMVDALPYLVDYPYGCTEQTLNRFVPTVITRNILKRMNLDLDQIRNKRVNLNPQELGDPDERAAQWKRWDRNPVFDSDEVDLLVKLGVRDITAMQNADGGWGWFSGYGERSYPHTTAVVVHGLQRARADGIALVPDVLERGITWLKNYQQQQITLLQEGERRKKLSDDDRKSSDKPFKLRADNIDAFVYMVLVDADITSDEMQQFLFRDRLELSLYAQALFGLALHAQNAVEQRDTVIRNIDQFLKVDDENQTAYLDLPNQGYWWYWYGSEIEANAFYLRLLTAVNPQDPKAAGLVKYLLNNRKHATRWNSTRDTAYCIEALADYLIATGEAEPEMTVSVVIDGEIRKSVEITPAVLFEFDNSIVIEGEELSAGDHTIEIRRTDHAAADGRAAGTGSRLYYNAWLTNFTTEEFITSAGLEIRVNRKFYKLVQRDDATTTVQGDRGQAISQKTLRYDRVELDPHAAVDSGDLIEIELEIDSKNDYEYIVFEDFKAAGCEPVDLRSGYIAGGLGAYVEFRDEKVAFFLRRLARGKHSLSYRVRAETPGRFSALPTMAYAMYAPELKGNSDEMKLAIDDPQHNEE